MNGKIPLTLGGFQRLEDELKNLRTVERPAVIRAIAEAREHGDLKENAEYHAARERQGFVEGRIQLLEDRLSRAEIVDVSRLSGTVVRFGATVTIVDADTGEEVRYQIVGEEEANIQAGLLSFTAPLARALIGRNEGESVEVITPSGRRTWEIDAVVYGQKA